MAVFNHPVTVRLAPTNYSPFSGSVSWSDYTDPSFNIVPHGTTDGIFPDSLIRAIPNNLYDIKNLCDDPTNLDVLTSQNIEINASASNPKRPTETFDKGGAYIDDSRAITTQTVNATVGGKSTFDLKGHAGCFVQYARSKGATAFNLFLHGRCDRETDTPPVFFESSTIPAPQGGIDNEGTFDNQDPTVSSYVTFKSSQAPAGPSITSRLLSFRKSLHHGFAKITHDNMAGMSMASGIGGKVYLTSFGSFNWGNVQGLSAGGRCTINTYSTVSGRSVNETAQANGIGNPVPGSVSCSAWVGTFEGIFGNNARFSNSATASLFRNTLIGGYEHNGAISSADSTYTVGTELTRYQLSATSSLSIRPEYAPTYGDKNYLAIGPRIATTPRLSTLNIVPGSYIRISGASNSANNGIYQVLSIVQGIPGDDNENIRFGNGPLYEYIELSRAITVEGSGSVITIQNVSDLPILHIKYREPVTS